MLNGLSKSYDVTLNANLKVLREKGQFNELIDLMDLISKDFSTTYCNSIKQLISNGVIEKNTSPGKNLFVQEFKLCSLMKILKNGIMKQAMELQIIEQEMTEMISENYNLIIKSIGTVQSELKGLFCDFTKVEMPEVNR